MAEALKERLDVRLYCCNQLCGEFFRASSSALNASNDGAFKVSLISITPFGSADSLNGSNIATDRPRGLLRLPKQDTFPP
jgi:hypothetical protein